MISRHLLVISALSLVASCTPQPIGGSGGEQGGANGKGGSGGSRSGGSGGSPSPGDSGGSGGGVGGGGGSGGAIGGSGGSTTPDAGGSDTQGPPSGEDCTGVDSKTLLCDPVQKEMPKKIRDTGFFPSAPDFSKHSARMLKFTPDPPLWSDGMEKERFLILPAGKKIDAANPKQWVFPVGTILVKTFSDDSGPGGKLRPIETRVIRRIGTETAFTEYDFYLYKWNADGTDADLLLDKTVDDQMSWEVDITIKRTFNGMMVNNGMPFSHTLPARNMCNDCHHDNGLTYQTFIGFDQIRLNSKLPGETKTQLQKFAEAGVFVSPPQGATIPSTDPLLAKALQFVEGNCVHCHNIKGRQFDLSPEAFVANTVNMKTDAQSVMPPADWRRVLPGDPARSVVYRQAKRVGLPMPTAGGEMNKLRPMPPFRVSDLAVDQEGVEALRLWICSLPGGPKVPTPECAAK